MPVITKLIASRLLIAAIAALGGVAFAEYPKIYQEFCVQGLQ